MTKRADKPLLVPTPFDVPLIDPKMAFTVILLPHRRKSWRSVQKISGHHPMRRSFRWKAKHYFFSTTTRAFETCPFLLFAVTDNYQFTYNQFVSLGLSHRMGRHKVWLFDEASLNEQPTKEPLEHLADPIQKRVHIATAPIRLALAKWTLWLWLPTWESVFAQSKLANSVGYWFSITR